MGQMRTRLGAGKRRHHATVQKATVVTDALGGRRATTWSDLGPKWWVAIEEAPSFNNEADAAQTYAVTGLYRADIVENHEAKVMLRIIGADKTLKAVLVQDPNQRHIDLIVHCVDAT